MVYAKEIWIILMIICSIPEELNIQSKSGSSHKRWGLKLDVDRIQWAESVNSKFNLH